MAIFLGAKNAPLTASFAPVLLLRFVRQQKIRVRMAMFYATAIEAIVCQLRGMLPIRGFGYAIFLAVGGIEFLIPYLADGWLASSTWANLGNPSNVVAHPMMFE